jgi:type I restriction enzyme R subunit
LANEMQEAGYTEAEAQAIKVEVDYYEKVREEIKLASGDYVDMKLYEPAMRHLLDTYIRAEDSEKLSAFDDLTLVQLIVNRGEDAVNALPEGLRDDKEAIAETIENNVRRLIIDEMAVNPKYYEKMSELLDALVAQRRQEAMDYKSYLSAIVALTRKASQPDVRSYPVAINNTPLRSLYDNLKDVPDLAKRIASSRRVAESRSDPAEDAAIAVDRAIRSVKKADWRGQTFKEREIRQAIRSVLSDDVGLVDTIFEIVRNQHGY